MTGIRSTIGLLAALLASCGAADGAPPRNGGIRAVLPAAAFGQVAASPPRAYVPRDDRIVPGDDRDDQEATRRGLELLAAERERWRRAEAMAVEKHGEARVVRLQVGGIPPYARVHFRDQVALIAGEPVSGGYSSAGSVKFLFAPVADMEAFAGQFDFAQDVRIDNAARLVALRVKEAAIPPILDPPVTNPRHPEFYRRSLADLTCWDDNRRRDAAQRLAAAKPKQLVDEIGDALAALLDHRKAEIRGQAALALAVWGRPEHAAGLVPLAAEEESRVAIPAMKALAALAEPEGIEAIARQLASEQSAVARAAAEFLEQVGPAAQNSVARLLTHESKDVRLDALQLLEAIGERETVVPILIPVLRDPDGTVRRVVLQILGRYEDVRAVEPVAQVMLVDQTGATACLIRMGPVAEDHVIKGLRVPDPTIVQQCCQILGMIGSEKSLEDLAVLARSDNTSVRSAAQKAGYAITLRGQLSSALAAPESAPAAKPP